MMKITQPQQDALTRQAAGVLSQFEPGEDAIAVLSRIYRQALPDKSPRQGDLAARTLVHWMERFRGSYDAAITDPWGHARYILTGELRALPLEDQCLHLQKIAGLPQTPDGPFTEQTRDHLLTRAVEVLTQPLELPAPEGEDPDPDGQLRQACGEEMLLAATAMILYTMAKKGELPGIPRDITLAQAAICVCANDLRCRHYWSAAAGYLSADRAQTLLAALTVALQVTWAAASIVLGVTFLAAGNISSFFSVLAVAPVADIFFRELMRMFLRNHRDRVQAVELKLNHFRSLPLEAPRENAPKIFPEIPALSSGENRDEARDDDLLSF